MAVPAFQSFTVRFGAGERIFTEGDAAGTLFIVQSGKVQLFRVVDGQKRLHGVLEKGDFFGEMSLLEGLPRTHSAEAIEDAELIEINSATFDKMIKSNIEISIRMLRKLSIRLREAQRRIEALEAAGGARPTVAARPAPSSAPHAAQGPGKGSRLEAEEGVVLPLPDSGALIGRYDPVTDSRPDVDLTPVDLKRSVSRRHARISRGEQGFSITEEVGALNGTFVNGTKLVAGRPHPLADGDRLMLGMVKLVFRA